MKEGFYWAQYKDDGVSTIVEVFNNSVYVSGSESRYDFDFFEEIAEFISKEPLTPPVAS